MRGRILRLGLVASIAACQVVDKTPGARSTPAPPSDSLVSGAPAPPPAAPAAAPPAAPGPAATRVVAVVGFLSPECVLHDTAQDTYFVSNVSGSATAKNNKGFVSRMRPDGAVENLRFIEGGRNGATLHAPKGMALRGDTLWVVDIDAVRGFDAKTGAPAGLVDLSTQGVVFLQGIAIAQNGALYITDTGINFDDLGNVQHKGPDRIFRIGPDLAVSVALRSDSLGWPSGIAVDPVGKRFLVGAFGGRSLLAWKPGERTPSVVARGPGAFDGVATAGGKLLVSSWNDSTVSSYQTGQAVKLVTGVPTPGQIGYDAKRNRVLVPSLSTNRVEIWQLP